MDFHLQRLYFRQLNRPSSEACLFLKRNKFLRFWAVDVTRTNATNVMENNIAILIFWVTLEVFSCYCFELLDEMY